MKSFNQFANSLNLKKPSTKVVVEAVTPMGQDRARKRSLYNDKIALLKMRIAYMQKTNNTSGPMYRNAVNKVREYQTLLSKI